VYTAMIYMGRTRLMTKKRAYRLRTGFPPQPEEAVGAMFQQRARRWGVRSVLVAVLCEVGSSRGERPVGRWLREAGRRWGRSAGNRIRSWRFVGFAAVGVFAVIGGWWMLHLLGVLSRQHHHTYLLVVFIGMAVIGNLSTKTDISRSPAMHCFSLDAVQHAW
jgi:ribose/xylose/arabinose/galactoside ABC-type transport system permease subunit